jgi:hypothetical protein
MDGRGFCRRRLSRGPKEVPGEGGKSRVWARVLISVEPSCSSLIRSSGYGRRRSSLFEERGWQCGLGSAEGGGDIIKVTAVVNWIGLDVLDLYVPLFSSIFLDRDDSPVF